ncbi:MAG: SpaA isopeptide-forming pilin-related protein [Eubacteriales bacterium]|nr:SpaA isopeptide-forming pilin-related protein [Eubacteriales bacterium]
MEDESGTLYDFKGYYEAEQDQVYYVLRETDTPAGYRPVPDIYLMYDPEDDVLKVMNPWNTGAVGNFSAEVYRMGETLKYQNEDGQGASQEISLNKAKKGIVLAVPMTIVKRSPEGSQDDETNWRPIYGTNLDGFVMADTNQSAANNTETMRKRMLKAALYQIHASQNDPEHYQSWYLSWSDEENGYLGTLSDLPGTPDRYYHTAEDTSADLAMTYYFVDGSVFDGADDAESKLEKLETAVSDALKDHETLDAAIDETADKLLSSFRQLNPECFRSSYGSLIYIPQAVNTLAVQAVGENGNPLEGVEFGLYESDDDTVYASGTTDSEGRLLFSAAADGNTKGQVNVPLVADGFFEENQVAYYLKVTDENRKNDTEIPVYVTTDRGVYVDAGSAEDKVSVQSGLGKLLGTMNRYAVKDGIDVTLRDITLEAGGTHTHTQKGEDDKELALHYGLDSALLDYGVHEKGILPVLITEEGEAFGKAYQNYDAHSGDNDAFNTGAFKMELDDGIELSALFTGSTTVVVGCAEEKTPPVTPPVTPPEEGDGNDSGDDPGGDSENEDGSGDSGDGDSSHSTGGNSGSHSSGGSSGSESGSSRSSVPAYYTRGIWSEDENGWTFRRGDGTAAISGWIYTDWNGEYGWYYFDENGRMKTGWLEYEGETYYLNPESVGIRGRMITGWKEIDGKWYYFSDISDGKRGKMLKGTETPDGYQVGADGVWIR